jgi:predicted DNA-binding transcriptional regulator AlpA
MTFTQNNPEPNRYLSERQASVYLGISDKTLQRHRINGTGPQFIKCGGRVLYDRNDCDAWMSSQKITSTAQIKTV